MGLAIPEGVVEIVSAQSKLAPNVNAVADLIAKSVLRRFTALMVMQNGVQRSFAVLKLGAHLAKHEADDCTAASDSVAVALLM